MRVLLGLLLLPALTCIPCSAQSDKERFLCEIRELNERWPQVREDLSRAQSDAESLQSRISRLEAEYRQMQSQLRSVAACDSPRR